MIKYKDVQRRLKNAGYTRTRIRAENLLSESTFARLKANQPLTTTTLDTICRLCQCKIEDIIEYIPDDSASSDAPEVSALDIECPSVATSEEQKMPTCSSLEVQIPVPGSKDLELIVTMTLGQK